MNAFDSLTGVIVYEDLVLGIRQLFLARLFLDKVVNGAFLNGFTLGSRLTSAFFVFEDELSGSDDLVLVHDAGLLEEDQLGLAGVVPR